MRSVLFRLPDNLKTYTGTILRKIPGGYFVECAELGRVVAIMEDQIVESETETESSENESASETRETAGETG